MRIVRVSTEAHQQPFRIAKLPLRNLMLPFAFTIPQGVVFVLTAGPTLIGFRVFGVSGFWPHALGVIAFPVFLAWLWELWTIDGLRPSMGLVGAARFVTGRTADRTVHRTRKRRVRVRGRRRKRR